jgi:hypothetical protein
VLGLSLIGVAGAEGSDVEVLTLASLEVGFIVAGALVGSRFRVTAWRDVAPPPGTAAKSPPPAP